MARLGNVLVVGSDPERLAVLVDSLGEHEYLAQGCGSTPRLLEEARYGRPDVVLIDIAKPGIDVFALVEEMRCDPQTKSLPVVLVTNALSDRVMRMARDLQCDDVMVDPMIESDYLHRMRPLIRLSTMHGELARRRATAEKFGGYPGPEADLSIDDAPYKLLSLGHDGGDTDKLESALGGRCAISPCTDFFAAEYILNGNAFDAAVIALDDNDPDQVNAALSFCSHIRTNPRLFNLPAVLLAPEGAFNDPVEPYRRGATRVLPRPASDEETRMALDGLVRRQRLRWRLRQALDATKLPETTETISGCYSLDFFAGHLETLIADARDWQKHLTVLFLSTPNIPEIRRQFGEPAANHLVQQLYQWIGGLIRAEDMVARYGDHEFCVALPDTPPGEARVVLHRIAGILRHTDFALQDVYQPISVWVMTGMASATLGENATSLIARSRESMA